MLTRMIAFRGTEELVARLDALADRLSRPGYKLSRADVARNLIIEALERAERGNS